MNSILIFALLKNKNEIYYLLTSYFIILQILLSRVVLWIKLRTSQLVSLAIIMLADKRMNDL